MGRHRRLHLEQLESFVQTPGTVRWHICHRLTLEDLVHVPRTRTVTLVMGRQVSCWEISYRHIKHVRIDGDSLIGIGQARLPSSRAGKSRADTSCSTAGDVRPRLVLECIVQKSRAVSLVKFQAEWYLDDSIRVFSYKITDLFCSHVKTFTNQFFKNTNCKTSPFT